MDFRVGLGYDVHAFERGRRLMLGGVEIPYKKGLKGHSDADVLLHSITDALLGAASLGDIGSHFPDTDLQYKDADSFLLLQKACSMVRSKGYQISNIDSTVVAQSPKLQPFIKAMCERISEAIDCSVDRVSVKATTQEKLGFVGRQEAIVVHSIALIYQD